MDIVLAQATEALSSGTAQEILAAVVGILLVALTWLTRLHLKERAGWETRFEALHEKTLGIALKVQRTIIELGELPKEDE